MFRSFAEDRLSLETALNSYMLFAFTLLRIRTANIDFGIRWIWSGSPRPSIDKQKSGHKMRLIETVIRRPAVRLVSLSAHSDGNITFRFHVAYKSKEMAHENRNCHLCERCELWLCRWTISITIPPANSRSVSGSQSDSAILLATVA